MKSDIDAPSSQFESDDWAAPPEFSAAGKPPPVRSHLKVLATSFVPGIGERSKHLEPFVPVLTAAFNKTDVEDDFDRAAEWLTDDHFREELRPAELVNRGRGSITDPRYMDAIEEWENAHTELERWVRQHTWKSYDGASLEDLSKTYVDRLKVFYPRLTSLRRVQYCAYWEREDPVTQLAPGSSTKVTRKITVGLSTTAAAELSSSLGVDSGTTSVVKLNATMQRKFSESVTICEQSEVTKELALINDKTETYRLYAIWHPVREVRVERLVLEATLPTWAFVQKTSYVPQGVVSTTSAAVSIGSV